MKKLFVHSTWFYMSAYFLLIKSLQCSTPYHLEAYRICISILSELSCMCPSCDGNISLGARKLSLRISHFLLMISQSFQSMLILILWLLFFLWKIVCNFEKLFDVIWNLILILNSIRFLGKGLGYLTLFEATKKLNWCKRRSSMKKKERGVENWVIESYTCRLLFVPKLFVI